MKNEIQSESAVVIPSRAPGRGRRMIDATATFIALVAISALLLLGWTL